MEYMNFTLSKSKIFFSSFFFFFKEEKQYKIWKIKNWKKLGIVEKASDAHSFISKDIWVIGRETTVAFIGVILMLISDFSGVRERDISESVIAFICMERNIWRMSTDTVFGYRFGGFASI